ncbi:sensor histidine kinase [Edaphobacter aggregans]|uniref:sensor histidine kinase n=1 Tax=Edaphobacter aggregans TaxID=570835 RepID=UPI00068DB948|nr:ATP-binding protein [Edaphobacter aggregans]
MAGQLIQSRVLRYGLAVFSVSVALGVALLLERFHFRDVADPLFLIAITVTVWYAGTGPAILAVVLGSMTDAYYFIEPIYSIYTAREDLPHFIIFILFAFLITRFAAGRHRVEAELLQARDKLEIEVAERTHKLEIEVAERTQQASLLNLTHEPIFVRDMNDVITYWNRGAQELYGWTPEKAIGKSPHELLRTVFPSPLEEIRAEFLRTGRWEGELKHTRADGTEVVVSSRWSLGYDEQGRPVAILETNNDITGRKRREQEIEKLNQELAKRSMALEASNKELEAFAYSISHDLRAPLRHMGGFAELLRKSTVATLDEKSARYVTMILEAANRMGSLIDDLLAFSRISRAEAHYSILSLEQLVHEAVAEACQDAKERNITWKLNPLPEWYGDRPMLRLTLVNLISNAVKFTRTRPQAEIEIGCSEQKDDHVVLFVRDNGVGFDMKYSNKLFGVFQRLHAQEAFEGTGIGLATVQRIVHRHGGSVWAEGIVDGGATFYFSLFKSQGAGDIWKP